MPKSESLDELIARKAIEFADEMKSFAAMADNEEEIRIEVEKRLAFIQKEAGIKLESHHEFTVASGRIDSVYSRVIIEYKNPKSPGDRIGPRLDSPGSKKVVEQIKKRFYDMRSGHGHELNTLFGVGFDGKHFIFIRYRDDKWQPQEPIEVSKYSAERFLWALFNLGHKGRPFSPAYLAGEFGSEAKLAQDGIHSLYEAIATTDHPKAQTFFNQWKILFAEVCGYDVDDPSEKIRKLAQFYGVAAKGLKPAELLFAVHTYYALFMKMLASEIVAFFHRLPTPLERMMTAGTSNKLKREMEDLEAGSIFRHLNITNFLEGDLFAWYTCVWTEPIEKLVRNMVVRLDNYNPGTLSEDPAASRDLVKKLYQQLFPKNVRHDLGEYYTPDWLADYVLNEVGYVGDPDKRVLDPACGSGTFLVMCINRVRKWFEDNRERCRMDEGELCRSILANVVGFDLNPLAVMAARTNYLIAIRDLIGHVEKVELPVYLCDSIMTPHTYGESGQAELFGRPMALKTSAKPTPFHIPREITRDRHILSMYSDLLTRMAPVKSGYSEDDFLQHCADEGLPIEQVDDHRQLFAEIRSLDRANKNGVWARIIKNAFAPLFVGTVDFIAGNPPWVNWDSLPENYRDDTKRLWVKHGLFSLSGTAGRLGGGKKDISMLFVYECLRAYAKSDGKLGFVITQSVFKTEGGADGFRRFEMASSDEDSAEPFRVYKVDDLSRLKPFEGAANRTAVVCISRNAMTKYPVPYDYWLPKRSATISMSADISEVLSDVKILRLHAAPVIKEKPTSPWLTVCPSALKPLRNAIGPSAYVAQAGATTCGADGVFLVQSLSSPRGDTTLIQNVHDVGKREIPRHQGQVSNEYLYPVCRGKDAKKWNAANELMVLMVQDPDTRVGIDPKRIKAHRGTWDFLTKFKTELETRKSSMLPKTPFYSIYGVGRDTFAPWKVVWGRVANSVEACVIGSEDFFGTPKVCLPFEAMMVAFEEEHEAHYLCGCLNSTPAQLIVVGSVVLHPDTHVLRRVQIPRYAHKDRNHSKVAKISKDCHEATRQGDASALHERESELDCACAEIWQLNSNAIDSMRKCLAELAGQRRRRKLKSPT